MAKKSKLDVKLLSSYFNTLKMSLAEIKKLTANNNIIKNAAKFVFGQININLCYLIVVAIRRDMGGFSQMLQNNKSELYTKLNISQDIFDYFLCKDVSLEQIKLSD